MAVSIYLRQDYDFMKLINVNIILSNLLLTLNSSINFIIYCITCAGFRQGLREMFCNRNKCDNSNNTQSDPNVKSQNYIDCSHLINI